MNDNLRPQQISYKVLYFYFPFRIFFAKPQKDQKSPQNKTK